MARSSAILSMSRGCRARADSTSGSFLRSAAKLQAVSDELHRLPDRFTAISEAVSPHPQGVVAGTMRVFAYGTASPPIAPLRTESDYWLWSCVSSIMPNAAANRLHGYFSNASLCTGLK